MSLKDELTNIIISRGEDTYTYRELVDYCTMRGYKVSNAERRMRESEDVEAVRNKKGYIIGYRGKQSQQKLF